jgi:transposase
MFYLHLYSPDFNPNEYLNHLMKAELQKKVQQQNQDYLKITILRIFRKLQKYLKKVKYIFDN